jgi:preprotein translocase subunit Sec63
MEVKSDRGYRMQQHHLILAPYRCCRFLLTFHSITQGGIHLKVAQEQLGQTNTSVTIDLYFHVMTVMHEDALLRVDNDLLNALRKRNMTGK